MLFLRRRCWRRLGLRLSSRGFPLSVLRKLLAVVLNLHIRSEPLIVVVFHDFADIFTSPDLEMQFVVRSVYKGNQ